MSSAVVPPFESILNARDPADVLQSLEQLLEAIENESTRAQALTSLHQLAAELKQNPIEHLFLQRLDVPGMKEPIQVLLNPAVFSPELWGRTFAEGLLKNPDSFHGKKVVELGTGCGWISLLLLNRTSATEILGLDINPVAITLANINKWLNGTRPDGSYVFSLSGVPIPKAFRAEVSDLLGSALARGEKFDRVIGCIPQVLHPVPEKADQDGGKLSYQDLYDLSNYCFNQGILEDRFGLPLIARALEEAQLCLSPQGMLTFILGGRPGQAAIEEVFHRRGYKPKLVWVRRIQQADDTDLVQLVKLEQAFGIKFHFFASPTSRQSIAAATAVGMKERNCKIYHDLLVYQAETKFERPTLDFVQNLHEMKLDGLRKELDLSRVSDEQMSFLDRLSSELMHEMKIRYPHEKSDLRFREKLALFLSVYCHYQVHPEDLFVGPERLQLLAMILKMVSHSNDRILLSSSLEHLYGSLSRHHGLEIILGNNDLDELLEFDRVFEPKICLVAPYQLKDLSPVTLDILIKHAQDHPDRWYLLDDSENFEIGSEIQSNLLIRLLGQKQLPPNLIFLFGLIKNTVCPDFELSFLLNAPREWVDGLEYCVDLTYSRISSIVQLYYEWLFDELLAFPFVEAGLSLPEPNAISGLSLSDQFKKVVADPVFDPKPISLSTPGLIRLDYGEFETTVPDVLVKGLIKGFLESRSDSLTDIVQERVAAYVKETRHATINPQAVVLGQGVSSLFGALIQTLRDKLGRSPVVGVPRGSYGPVFPMLEYYGARIQLIETNPEKAFVLSAEDIQSLKSNPDLLWLTQPGNPSGVFIESEAIRKITRICAERGIYIFSDEIFFLLSDSTLGSWTPAELSFAYGIKSNDQHNSHVFFCDGLAKAFAAGGLRCGFMSCPDSSWADHMRNYLSPVPQAVLRSWDRLYSVFLESSPHVLINNAEEFDSVQKYLLEKRAILSDNRARLLLLLQAHGISDGLKYARRGGLFVMARLADRAAALAQEEALLINPDGWSRAEGWSRICLSVAQSEFEIAMGRLSSFLTSSGKQ